MIAQIVFVVWRESIEALLVIGILQAWLRHNGSAAARIEARMPTFADRGSANSSGKPPPI